MTVNDAMYKVYGIIKRGGPMVTEYANLSKAFEVIEASPYDPGIVEWMVQQLELENKQKYFHFIPHIYRQPYGYAGDFALLSKMYELNDFVTHRKGSLYNLSNWDRYVASLPSTQSVFNREEYLLKSIGRKIEQDGAWRILDIACGNGRLLKKLKEKYPHIWTMGIDNEDQAIQEAFVDQGQSPMKWIKMNALKELPDIQVDVVVSAGLCDYLSEAAVIRLLQRVRRQYDPELIIFGNLTHHECEPLMNLLGWNLIYRDARELEEMIEDHVEFRDHVATVGQEDLGINLFLEVEKDV